MNQHDANSSRDASASPVPGPPRPGHGDGIDLSELRNRVTELLDEANTGGRLTTIDVPGAAEPEAMESKGQGVGLSDPDADSETESTSSATDEQAQPVHTERLLEVTDEQVEALSAAHDELARALSALDTKR